MVTGAAAAVATADWVRLGREVTCCLEMALADDDDGLVIACIGGGGGRAGCAVVAGVDWALVWVAAGYCAVATFVDDGADGSRDGEG